MSKTDDIAQAILDTRQEIIGSWLRGPDGSELLRLEKAFKALTGLEPPSIGAVAARLNGSISRDHAPTDKNPIPAVKVTEIRQPRSVRAATKELFQSSSKSWSSDEILKQFDRQGEQFHVKHLRDTLRTALLQLQTEGLIERVARGYYRTVSKVSVTEAEGSLPSLGDGEG